MESPHKFLKSLWRGQGITCLVGQINWQIQTVTVRKVAVAEYGKQDEVEAGYKQSQQQLLHFATAKAMQIGTITNGDQYAEFDAKDEGKGMARRHNNLSSDGWHYNTKWHVNVLTIQTDVSSADWQKSGRQQFSERAWDFANSDSSTDSIATSIQSVGKVQC